MLSLNTDNKNLPIAITMGDPSGINSEIILKAFKQINNRKISFFIICDPDWIKKSKKIFNINIPINIISKKINIKKDKLNILPLKNNILFDLGQPNKKNNKGTVSFDYRDLDQLNHLIEIIKKNYDCTIVSHKYYLS